ncbi:hypothetical protein BH11MYX3_BH11MYX3_20790 [soil metagenome]
MGIRHARALSIVVLGGVAAVLLVASSHRARARDGMTQARGPLSPDPAIVHYRYPIAAAQIDPLDDLSATITALEVRVSQPVASPMEMADLADLYLRRAQMAADPDDYKRSETVAKRSLELLRYPSSAPLTLAKLASARHEFRTAIALAREFLAHAKSPGALGVLASSHLARGELERASEAAEWAVSVKPDSAGYLMRALVFQAQGRDAEAAFDFAHAAVIEEASEPEEAARLRTLWARFLLRRGDWAGAELLLAEAVRIAPDYPLAVAQQGELALRTGNPKLAKQRFEQAFISGHQVRYLIDEARAQELAGDLAGATSTRGQVEKLVRGELRDNGLGHLLDLVEILVDRGTASDVTEAISLARDEVLARPGADTRFQLARALAAGSNRREALEAVRGALATGTRDARVYELASRLERAGNSPRADLYAGEAAKLDAGSSGWRVLGLRVP